MSPMLGLMNTYVMDTSKAKMVKSTLSERGGLRAACPLKVIEREFVRDCVFEVLAGGGPPMPGADAVCVDLTTLWYRPGT